MKIKDYINLGINHYLLFEAECSTSHGHYDTLKTLVNDDRFEIIDLWIVDDEPYRCNEIDLVANCGKEVYYNCGNRAGKPGLEPASFNSEKRQYTINTYKDEIAMARSCSAVKVVTNSGPNNLGNRPGAFDLLVDFYCKICEFAPEMQIIIEPTDFDMSKCKLIGSSKESVEICRRVKMKGYENISSMVDMCHIPLMHETLEQAIKDTEDFLGHIHLGNCILKDSSHKLYGDKHVPLCMVGGEYGIDDLAELFKVGLETGYFNKKSRGSASIEMRTFPGDEPLKCLDLYYSYVIQAWKQAIKKIKYYE